MRANALSLLLVMKRKKAMKEIKSPAEEVVLEVQGAQGQRVQNSNRQASKKTLFLRLLS